MLTSLAIAIVTGALCAAIGSDTLGTEGLSGGEVTALGFVAAMLGLAGATGSLGRWPRSSRAMLVLAAAALGAMLVTASSVDAPNRDEPIELRFVSRAVRQRVSADRSRPPRTEGVVETCSGSRGCPRAGDVVLIVNRAFPVGSRWEAEALLLADRRRANPSPAFALGLSPKARVSIDGRSVRRLPDEPWRRRLAAVRTAVRDRARHGLDATTANLLNALVLGDVDDLDDETIAHFRATGLAHVLAVSGMHVTLVLGTLLASLRGLFVRLDAVARRWAPLRVAAGVLAPIAPLYATFAGASPSAMRAGWTAAIAFCLVAGGRQPDPVAVTAASVVLFAVVHPHDLVHPAFLLSIAATAALLSPLADTSRSPLGALFRATLRASLGTAPLVLVMFARVPLIGLAANVLVAPLLEALLIPLLHLHAALAVLASPLTAASGAVATCLTRGVLALVSAIAAWPLHFEPPPLTPLEVAASTAVACALLVRRLGRVRWHIVIAAAMVTCGDEWRVRVAERPRGRVRATFLDVGQGDAAIVDMPDGRVVAIDVGGDDGERVLLPLLRARRRAHLDVVVVTHPHPDHYRGLEAVLQRVPVGELWTTDQAERETPSSAYAHLVARARARHVRIVRAAALCTAPRAFGAAELAVVHPCPDWDAAYSENDNSIVMKLSYERRSILFAGDVEGAAEARIAADPRLSRIDVLKVPHHGSRTSSTEPFVTALDPRHAIVSAGRANRFGHPHGEVLARYRQRHVLVHRTDNDGGVTLDISRGSLRFSHARRR